MPRKIYRDLTPSQRMNGVIFSSTLSTSTAEQPGDTIHEVKRGQSDADVVIGRLVDDRFFARSHWKYNIIRR